jgi:hypothetical protein
MRWWPQRVTIAFGACQQEKMKRCNADASAKSLKGDDRKAFMSEGLKPTRRCRL